MDDTILENAIDLADFSDYFKVIEYANIYQNIKKGLDKDKARKKAFMQKLNGKYFLDMGYPLEAPLELGSLKSADLHGQTMKKIGSELPVGLCSD